MKEPLRAAPSLLYLLLLQRLAVTLILFSAGNSALHCGGFVLLQIFPLTINQRLCY